MNPMLSALRELEAVALALDDAQVEAACQTIARAHRILAYGCGREGLMLRALVMRLHHLGLQVAMQGDMAAPPLGAGDLFLCSAGPGELSTVTALMGVAQRDGAEVLMITAEPDQPSPRRADQLLVIPAQTMARDIGGQSTLPMGSLYEGAMFLVFEIMVLRLTAILGQTAQQMRARHTNME
jgi:6-phospho-3-hexuloisomerase